MNSIKTYKVTSKLSWAAPGQLIFVQRGQVVGYQTNPENGLTKEWVEDGQEWTFNPEDYSRCELVT